MLAIQVQEPQERLAPGIGLRLLSLAFGGAALGLRVARFHSPALVAVVIAGVLGMIALVFVTSALSARRRLDRAQANHPGAVGISASVSSAAMVEAGSPPARRGFPMLAVTALLLPDRLILVRPRSKARRGMTAERAIPFDQVRAASWSSGYGGLRQIPVLRLTLASGEPVLIRLDAVSRRATTEFMTATNSSLAQWLRAAAPPAGPTGSVKVGHVFDAGLLFAVALIVLSVSGGYVAGTAIMAKTPASADRWVRPDRAIGVAGYYTYGGPHGKGIQPGAPWGRPCKPILVRVDKGVPDIAYSSFVEVVHEARAAGIDITIANRNNQFMPSELYPPGQHFNTVQTADVFADNKAPTQLTSGAPNQENIGWDASLAPDGHHEYVTDLQILLHLRVLGTNPTGFRKAALAFVGFTQGVGVSTTPRSAFAAHVAAAADKFSAQDIRAMLTMSGCAAISPAIRAGASAQ